jgi:hypothetical protein
MRLMDYGLATRLPASRGVLHGGGSARTEVLIGKLAGAWAPADC